MKMGPFRIGPYFVIRATDVYVSQLRRGTEVGALAPQPDDVEFDKRFEL
mgnify:CR=1 FL=1